jgi:DNA-binding HxlR family transcriptional regulator
MKRTERTIFQRFATPSARNEIVEHTSTTVVSGTHQDARSGDNYVDGIGDLCSVLIVRDALAGSHRLEEFRRSIGAPEEALATRLAVLVGQGILQRHGTAGSAGDTYVPTEKGLELRPILEALARWGRLHPSPPVNAKAAPRRSKSDPTETDGL